MFSFFRKKSPVIPFYDKTPVTVQRDEFTSGNAVHPWHHAFDKTVTAVNRVGLGMKIIIIIRNEQ